MTDEASPQPSPDPPGLQFDRAEPARPAEVSASCSACKQPLAGAYYLAATQKICSSCRDVIHKHLTGGSTGARAAKATLLGLLTAVGGGLAWAVITVKWEGSPSGLLAILLGFLVGLVVRKGSEGRGGRGYQALAVALTYIGLATGYSGVMIPAALKKPSAAASEKAATPGAEKPADPAAGTSAKPPAPAGGCLMGMVLLIGLLGICLASPVLVAIQSPFTILMVAIALWEAWRMNRGIAVQLRGPFQLGGGASPENSASG